MGALIGLFILVSFFAAIVAQPVPIGWQDVTNEREANGTEKCEQHPFPKWPDDFDCEMNSKGGMDCSAMGTSTRCYEPVYKEDS